MSKVIQKFPAVYAGNRILDVLDFKNIRLWNALRHLELPETLAG